MDDIKKWIFPKHIAFEHVADYMKKFYSSKNDKQIVFDLSNSTRVHSSFIGFLIYAKSVIEENGGSLQIILSTPVKKLFLMLQVFNHFAPIIFTEPAKKSA